MGLKPGKHEFQMEVDASFFDSFPFSEISKAEGMVNVILDKLGNGLDCHVNFQGLCQLPCDRCLSDLELPLTFQERLIVQLGGQTDLENDIWTLGPELHELNLAQPVFEWIHLCLPFRRVHPDLEACDPTMIDHLAQSSRKDEKGTDDGNDAIDPRWNALKDLK
ncbi:MAG: DUF177 domain-containing protein [Flavobacteriales bacterium]|nr:DUF177 domain-containing protein [Flavobacteriales bacterium]